MIKALLYLTLAAIFGGCCVNVQTSIPATPEQDKNSGRDKVTNSKNAPLDYPSVIPLRETESGFSPAWNIKASDTAGRSGSPLSKGESVTSFRLTQSTREYSTAFRPDLTPSIYSPMGRSPNCPSGEVRMSSEASASPNVVQDWDRWYRTPAVPRSWWYLQKKRGQ